MSKIHRSSGPMPTIWDVSEAHWQQLEIVLAEHDPPARTGRPRCDQRQALNGIIYHMRTGCQWEALPRRFGPKSSVHDTFQRWVRLGIFEKIMAFLIDQCDELGGVDWQWQSADGAMGKARFGGIKWAPTPPIAAKTGQNAA